jgi:hypothetical protein
MVLMGGYSDPAEARATDTVDVVNTGATPLGAPPAIANARAEACAALIADDAAIVVGGRTQESTGGAMRSEAAAFIVRSTGSNIVFEGAPSLPIGRYGHTCTALPDGTVLVTGGLKELGNGVKEVLQDAWIYQPVPLD